MPELPEVETVRTGLARSVQGARIVRVVLNRADLRIPFPPRFEQQIKGSVIDSVARRAKYLLLRLDNGMTLIIHLGMSGQLTVSREGAYKPRAHDHVLFHLEDGRVIVFHDPRRFGLMTLVRTQQEAQHALLAKLGPEPLDKGFTPNALRRALRHKSQAVKQAIMDQQVVVGVGNIYACEALFDCGLNPWMESGKVAANAEKLVPAIKSILRAAIRSGGSTLRDYVRSTGDAGYFQHAFRVYGREGEPCVRCKTAIQRAVQAGRSTFYCPSCQNKK